MATTTAKLYSFNLSNAKTYLFASLFVVGNLVFPQLAHLVPNGGFILLPIYFFTLIAAYKYGIHVGLLTAILSPVANNLIFGMPPSAVLPMCHGSGKFAMKRCIDSCSSAKCGLYVSRRSMPVLRLPRVSSPCQAAAGSARHVR